MEHILSHSNQYKICTALGIIGGLISTAFGGWNEAMTTLLIFMALDYLSGVFIAAVLKKSPKTDTGGLQSKIGFVGICKKGMILVLVLIAFRLDLMLGIDYIKNSTIIACSFNELVSIIENAGVIGVPIPPIILNSIDLLKKKADIKDKENQDNTTDNSTDNSTDNIQDNTKHKGDD